MDTAPAWVRCLAGNQGSLLDSSSAFRDTTGLTSNRLWRPAQRLRTKAVVCHFESSVDQIA